MNAEVRMPIPRVPRAPDGSCTQPVRRQRCLVAAQFLYHSHRSHCLNFTLPLQDSNAHRLPSPTLPSSTKLFNSVANRHDALPQTLRSRAARDRDDRRWHQNVHLASCPTATSPDASQADSSDRLLHGADRDSESWCR